IQATLKLLIGWLGHPLEFLWPWPLVAVIIPGIYFLYRCFRDLRGRANRSPSQTTLTTWIDLVIPFVATVGVAIAIGYGRGKSHFLWDSRYCTLLLPIGLMIYLVMVRLRAPAFIPAGLAFLMTFSVGWNWSTTLGVTNCW